jgi:amidophosphoribosyltransferase
VSPSPASPAAVGYAKESGIPFGQGLTKNAYVGRTFIQPSQTIRQLGIRLKLNPLKEVIPRQAADRRRRLRSCRGNTQRALVPDAA